MSPHLSPDALSALADGELAADQLLVTNQHLSQCPTCTTSALQQMLLKSALAKAGQRYAAPPGLEKRLRQLSRQEEEKLANPNRRRPSWSFALSGWTAAMVTLVVLFAFFPYERRAAVEAENSAFIGELSDQHIATLASNAAPQVVSSDRHTVKPWFQGKLAFSFNLPEDLPAGTMLDGANLIYLQNRPAAQLLYRIGKHRVSVYLTQQSAGRPTAMPNADREGFHLASFRAGEIVGFVVSDVERSSLSALVDRIAEAQTKSPPSF